MRPKASWPPRPTPVTPSISRATIADRRSGYVPAAVTSGSRNRSDVVEGEAGHPDLTLGRDAPPCCATPCEGCLRGAGIRPRSACRRGRWSGSSPWCRRFALQVTVISARGARSSPTATSNSRCRRGHRSRRSCREERSAAGPHHHQVGPVDAFEGVDEYGLDTEEERPFAAQSRDEPIPVVLAPDHDQGGYQPPDTQPRAADALHGAVGEVGGHPTLGSRGEAILDPGVHRRCRGHHAVVAAAGTVRVEVGLGTPRPTRYSPAGDSAAIAPAGLM